MKRTLKWIALIAAPILVVAFVVFSLVQPLLRSRAYALTATLDGRPIQAELRHPPFMPGLYYVLLPEAQLRRYSSFGIAFARQSVFWPGGHYTGWYGIRYIHTDQAGGIRLTDSKIEDHWNVIFKPDGVQFSNAALSITLERNR